MIQQVRKKVEKDNYIYLAFARYQSFKQTEEYDEFYKWDVLTELNEYMNKTEIIEATVVEIAEHIRKNNPSTGSFVHWSNLDDLVSFAKAKPEEVARLWNQLYDASLPLSERINAFRMEGKKFSKDLSLGAPLFGYLLAAYDY